MISSEERLMDQRVVGIAGFEHVTRRRKLIGKNAKKDVHGWDAREEVIRIYTDREFDGIGFGRVEPPLARKLIGQRIGDLWRSGEGSVGFLGRADHALFDLVGKILGLPAWKLLGGNGRQWVPVYDTSIYFSDLLPAHETRGVARILEEVDEGLNRGHTAFKLKVGRGARWMDHEEGLARDIQIVLAVRQLCGPDIRIMADANDQFGLVDSKKFLDACAYCLDFLEEPFPENERDCCELREWMIQRGVKTMLADGESQHDPSVLAALAKRGALDVLQPDIRAHGLSLQRLLAKEISDLPMVRIASHNWGSYLGTYHMLQLGRGIDNFLIAEVDETVSELFNDEEWRLENGRIQVPDHPGCGLQVREDVYRKKYLPNAWCVGKIPGK
jgi:L-alanine-DL-glutamate epimerase-like enolase superfamily enzyme